LKGHTSVSRARKWVRANNKAPFFVALMVFAATLAAYLYYWGNLRANVQKDMTSAYQRQVRILSGDLTTRLQLYETLLRGGSGIFMLNNSITGDNWRHYFEPYEIAKNYPDIQGIGFSRYIPRDQLGAFIEERRASGDTGYDVFPAGDRPEYVPSVFSARYSTNGSKIGYDGFANETRRAAMLRAAESGQPAMTGRLTLANDVNNKSAFIIYLPVYKPDLPLTTPAERRAALYGFSSMGVDVRRVFGDLQNGASNPNFAFRLVDPEYQADNPGSESAYASDDFSLLHKKAGGLTTTSNIALYGHTWQMTFVGGPGLISSAERALPAQALFRGIFSSLLFACIVWYLITYRERKINSWKQHEVQTAKDDLLSLASHQLRTPATVVKQYVGMLLQGYGGDLTDRQIAMLRSAYESNERQLEIINQLLYVARLDAGRITLRKERVRLAVLIGAVVEDQTQAARERHQQVIVSLPKKLSTYGDPRYLRMVFENLLSNAIKYTPDGGTITIKGHQGDNDRVVVSVTDTGVGMDMASTKTIFDKFTRVENILSTDVNGSGVGLYLTREIINLHNGEIKVESERGAGSTFTVYLSRYHKEAAKQ
jgi:two-component system, OmpR family, sensor kinase